MLFPYPTIIISPPRMSHRPIDFRETTRHRVLSVGNINSHATGFDIKRAGKMPVPQKNSFFVEQASCLLL